MNTERIRAVTLEELRATPQVRLTSRALAALLAIQALTFAAGMGMAFGPKGHGHLDGLGLPLLALGLVVGLWGPFAAVRPGFGLLRTPLFVVAGLTALLPLVGAAPGGTESLLRSGLPCFATQLAFWFLPAATAVWALRGFAFSARRALLAGAAAGAAGQLTLSLHCTVETALHRGLFHAVPYVLLALTVLVVRERVPSRSFVP